MNTEFKTKWLEALRSGKYKQTKGALHNKKDNGYCCLGVLCEIGNLNHVTSYNYGSGLGDPSFEHDDSLFKTSVDGKGQFLKATEMTHGQLVALATMNDYGKSFAEIADYIEQEL